MKNKLLIILIFPTLTACANQKPISDYSHYLRNKNITAPQIESFTHCYNYGCKTKKLVSMPDNGWRKLNAIFTPPSKTPAQERKRISKAIAVFENHVGEQTGTSADLMGTFKPFTREKDKPLRFQQDCVDESTNTTIYLALLKQKGWIKFYDITQPQSRQPFIGGNRWWHQSATIKDAQTGQQYAVDSWFEDNGAPAYIVKIENWFNGWKPSKTQ